MRDAGGLQPGDLDGFAAGSCGQSVQHHLVDDPGQERDVSVDECAIHSRKNRLAVNKRQVPKGGFKGVKDQYGSLCPVPPQLTIARRPRHHVSTTGSTA